MTTIFNDKRILALVLLAATMAVITPFTSGRVTLFATSIGFLAMCAATAFAFFHHKAIPEGLADKDDEKTEG